MHGAVAGTFYRSSGVVIKKSVNKSIQHFPSTQSKEMILMKNIFREQSKLRTTHKALVILMLIGTIFSANKSSFLSQMQQHIPLNKWQRKEIESGSHVQSTVQHNGS